MKTANEATLALGFLFSELSALSIKICLNDNKINYTTWRTSPGTKSCSKKSLHSSRRKGQRKYLFLAPMLDGGKSRKVISMFLWYFPKQKVC
jgi:hypothetical protein